MVVVAEGGGGSVGESERGILYASMIWQLCSKMNSTRLAINFCMDGVCRQRFASISNSAKSSGGTVTVAVVVSDGAMM